MPIPEGWHSHKVRAQNGIMIVNHEKLGAGGPADFAGGLAIYDVSKPSAPKSSCSLSSNCSPRASYSLPLTILQVYDRVIPHQSIETLTMLLLGLVVVVAIDATLRISRAYVIAWAATRFTQAAVVTAFDRVMLAPRQVQI